MKSKRILASIALLGITSVASAVPIGTTGGADSLVAWGSLGNSGDATERQFIAEYLNVDASSLTYTQLTNSGGEDGGWLGVDEDLSLFAFSFGLNTPALFLIKSGANVGLPDMEGSFDTFLYSNTIGTNWAVIDLDFFTRTNGNVEIEMISHVGLTGGSNSVPEPATLGLLGLGLAGIGFARRKRK